jgi:hypothetical protein
LIETPIEDNRFYWSIYITPQSGRTYREYSEYLTGQLNTALKGIKLVSPSVARVWEKNQKYTRIQIFNRDLVQEELFAKKEAEIEKTRRKIGGNRQVQHYSTIYIGDTRLKMIAHNQAEEDTIEAIELQKQEREKKKTAEGIVLAQHKADRVAKREAKEAEKEARKAAKEAKKAAKDAEKVGRDLQVASLVI